jgi:hemerythrin-like domain-containing protein
MTPTQIMESEHRLIETVVRALGTMAVEIENGQTAEIARVDAAVEFLRIHADQLHHTKEEDLLFPLLVQRGLSPQGCPIGVLRYDHAQGRALVQSLAEQARRQVVGEAGANAKMLATLRAILDLYENHIRKEDTILFPVTNRILTPSDQAALRAQFVEVDRAVGLETIARLESVARSCASIAQPARPFTGRSVCFDCRC